MRLLNMLNKGALKFVNNRILLASLDNLNRCWKKNKNRLDSFIKKKNLVYIVKLSISYHKNFFNIFIYFKEFIIEEFHIMLIHCYFN